MLGLITVFVGALKTNPVCLRRKKLKQNHCPCIVTTKAYATIFTRQKSVGTHEKSAKKEIIDRLNLWLMAYSLREEFVFS